MKKLLLLSAFIAAVTMAHAQSGTAVSTKTAYSDTALNADTVYCTFNPLPGSVTSLTFVLNRLTGALPGSGGYVFIQGSNDGMVWFPSGLDTLTISNAAQLTKSWLPASLPYAKYRAVVRIPSGTQTSQANLTYARKPTEYYIIGYKQF